MNSASRGQSFSFRIFSLSAPGSSRPFFFPPLVPLVSEILEKSGYSRPPTFPFISLPRKRFRRRHATGSIRFDAAIIMKNIHGCRFVGDPSTARARAGVALNTGRFVSRIAVTRLSVMSS